MRHLQFGLVYTTKVSVCRLELGLGRGFTSWITPYQMAENLSEHDCLEEARNHHILGKRRRVHARFDVRESDNDEHQH